MMDKLVSSIIEAEEYAKHLILEAEKEASDSLADAERIIEQHNRHAAQENKDYLSQKMQGFREESMKAAQKYFDENNQLIDKEINSYRANTETAVKKVMGKL